MGTYLNPSDGSSKENFLKKNGEQLENAPVWENIPKDSMAVCLIDNGMFTAAGIADSKSELNSLREYNGRTKTWYNVPKTLVKTNSA